MWDRNPTPAQPRLNSPPAPARPTSTKANHREHGGTERSHRSPQRKSISVFSLLLCALCDSLFEGCGCPIHLEPHRDGGLVTSFALRRSTRAFHSAVSGGASKLLTITLALTSTVAGAAACA